MSMSKEWNAIDFPNWQQGNVGVSTNEYGEGPVILELFAQSPNDSDLSEWMTPAAARELAAQLNRAADAAERAGKASGAE